MDKRPPKCKGGAEKLQEKKIKNLQADSSKCAKMFGAVVAASTSALPEAEEEERWLAIQRSRNNIMIVTGKKPSDHDRAMGASEEKMEGESS